MSGNPFAGFAYGATAAGGSGAAAAALAGTKKRAQPDPPQQGVDAGQHGFRSQRPIRRLRAQQPSLAHELASRRRKKPKN